jgi:hypothetical protein
MSASREKRRSHNTEQEATIGDGDLFAAKRRTIELENGRESATEFPQSKLSAINVETSGDENEENFLHTDPSLLLTPHM